ncbi:hypothetical protein AN1V17_04950 [Vallitalea sediminicola]
MNEKLNNITNIEQRLTSLSIEPCASNTLSGDSKYKITANYEIVENTNEFFSVFVKIKSTFEPEAKFSNTAFFTIKCTISQPISDEEIRNSIDYLLFGLGNQNSQIISFLTDKMFRIPFISPPSIDEISEKKLLEDYE